MQNQQSNTGCVLNVIVIGLLIVIAFGVFGGALMAETDTRQAPDFPNIPAPASAQLNYVPSVQTFAEPAPPAPVFDPCADRRRMGERYRRAASAMLGQLDA